ncbi:MAG TPA: AAA family ATPase, partial [Acidimicrobiia bacterium]|nr:AAA family ATPase [Acidimicrobiia bacterium]
DVYEARERQRQRRLKRIAYVLAPIVAWLWIRIASGNPVSPGLPQLSEEAMFWLPGILIVLLLGVVLVVPMLSNGRSPEVVFLPEQINVSFDDVKGLGPVLGEVRHTLDVFLNHKQFRDEMGGQPRRGILFEGPPGTGKTHTAQAMAKEAGVPFLFVSSTAFQSMWYGATARKIRSYFRKLRKIARAEGGAIGFIEEFDAIGAKRGGMDRMTPSTGGMQTHRAAISEGTGGVVNELLVQMQSFDEPTRGIKFRNSLKRLVNLFLPASLHLKARQSSFANVLLIGATNRADSLDPALLRPGRFDRVLHFGMPARNERRELIELFLSRKAHDETLDEQARDDLAASTMGYSPASLERLFDEALLFALRDDRRRLSTSDLRKARMDIEIGLAQPTEYTAEERETIAVHESGHAVMAYLVGKGRKMELLSIVKRKDSLGLLAHTETEERYTKRRSETLALIQIALGGMVAEELFYGESGTGPSGDLAAATNMAVEMVGSMGLGDSLISFRALEGGLLGGNLVAKVLADNRGRDSVDRILNEQKVFVTDVLTRNRHLVEALRDALLERNELVGRELVEILDAASQDTVVDLREPVA